MPTATTTRSRTVRRPPETMAIADIKIRDGFNIRAAVDEELAESIELVGVLVPLLVDEDGYLVAGHRRLAAARKAGLEEVPFRLVSSDRALAAAAAENIARQQLSPSEEARAIQRMLDAGLTADGAARTLGLSAQKVTRRLELLKVPEQVRELWNGADGAPKLEAIAAVVKLLDKAPALAPLIEHAHRRDALDPDLDPYERLDVGLLAREPEHYLNELRRDADGDSYYRAADKSGPDWPDGVTLVSVAQELRANTPGLDGELAKRIKAANDKARQGGVWNVRPMLEEADVDAARAAGVLLELEDQNGATASFVCDLEWLASRVEHDVLPRFEKEVDRLVKAEARRRGKSTAAAGGDPAKLTKAEREAQQKAEQARERDRRWAQLAPGANLDFGGVLLHKLASVELTVDVARFFAEFALGERPGSGYEYNRATIKLAAAGMRYVMPGWQLEQPAPTKAQPNRTKITYLEPKDAEQKLWEWFDRAEKPGEILGRALVIHAAARWAAENCVAASSRTLRDHGGSNEWNTRGSLIPKGPARDALDRITQPLLPVSLKQLIKEMEDANG